MGLFTDCNQCAECGQEVKDGERVIVSQVTGGYYRDIDGSVELDCYDIELEIRHKKCWMEKPDEQLPESICEDGSIAK